jgi:PAS domain S-box-containing protein
MAVCIGNQPIKERWLNALWLLAGLLLAVALLFAAKWEADHRQRMRMDSFRNDIADLARVSETIIAGRLGRFDDSLLVLRDAYAADPKHFVKDIELLRSGPLADRELLVALVDRHGYLIHTDTPNVKPGLYRGDQPYFRYFTEGGKDTFYVSAPVFGRVTNRYSIPLVRPIYDKQGGFLGVVAFSVTQESIANFGNRLQFSGDTAISVIYNNGAIVSRSRDLDKVQGTRIQPELLAPMLKGTEGVFSNRSTHDGVERIIAYRHVHSPGTPLIVYVEASPGNVLNDTSMQRSVLTWGAGFISLLIMVLIVIYLKGRKVAIQLIDSLRRSKEQEYETLTQASLDGFFIADNAGRFLDANDTLCKMLGYDRDKLLCLSMSDIEAAESPEQVAAHMHAIMATGRERFLTRLRDMGDKTIDVEINVQHLKQRDGRFFAFVRDITERKKADRTMLEQLHFLQQLLDAIPIPIFYKDRQGVYRGCNKAYETFAHKTKEEIIGKTVFEVAPRDLADIYHEADELLFTQPGVQVYETSFLRSDGNRRNIIFNKATFVDEDGHVIGLVGVITDITERRLSEEERRDLQERLNRSEKMEALGQLAGGVAHDLNNVLGVSTIYSELLQEKIPEGDSMRSYVDSILSSNQKAAAIIEDLLTLARRSVTVSETMNLNTVVGDFLKSPEFEKIRASRSNVTFRKECDDLLMNIKGSRVHVEKTLMNLVSNAAESISGKGEVTIRTQSRYIDKPVRGYDEVKEGDYAVLTISDTGMGIPAENIDKIFEPFYTKKKMGRSGTGLGLAIVWGTVKDHNGYIDVQTEVGGGSVFTLYFPMTVEEVIAQQQKVQIEQYMGRGESVLVVDDIAEQREIASNLLARLGYRVHKVSSGEEAMEYLKTHQADIMVLDMIMDPGFDGLETYRRILEINPKQKAIIVSGFSETERVNEAQKLGAGAYVKKPYMIEKIGVAVRDELGKL